MKQENRFLASRLDVSISTRDISFSDELNAANLNIVGGKSAGNWGDYEMSFLDSIEVEPSTYTENNLRTHFSPITISEGWNSITHLPSKIVEIGEDYILMDCVVDVEINEIQLRKFDKENFENSQLLKVGDTILITIMKRPGKLLMTISSAKNMGYDRYFSMDQSLLKNLKSGALKK